MNRLADVKDLARRFLRDDAGFFDQLDVGLRAAVADRRLVCVHLDDGVVHTHGGERGEHVLHRMHPHRAFADRGRALDGFQVLDLRVDVGSSGRSLRLNLIPWSTGAGCRLSVTFSPVCSEVPLRLAVFATVCWSSGVEDIGRYLTKNPAVTRELSRIARPASLCLLALQPKRSDVTRGPKLAAKATEHMKTGNKLLVGWMGCAVLAANAAAQLPNVPLGNTSIEVQTVVTGLSSPVEMVSPPDDSGRLFIVEQPGRIRILQNGIINVIPFLDIRDEVLAGGERGLLGLAFHPGFSNPLSPGFQRLYTYSTQTPAGPSDFIVPMLGSPDNRCVLTEWQVLPATPNVVDLSSRRDVLRFTHPQSNHNGGKIAFRPSDGYLYIAVGDGGGANDVGDGHTTILGNAQDRTNLLGKILRIDPLAPSQNPASLDPISSNTRYRIAASNPFVGAFGFAEEIYAYGFRNPFRFSFDVTTDRLIVGDVGGQSRKWTWSSAARELAGIARKGCFLFNSETGVVSPDPSPNPAFVNPVLEYDHDDGNAVIGGFVYHGVAIPALTGRYVFADFVAPNGNGRLLVGISPRARSKSCVSAAIHAHSICASRAWALMTPASSTFSRITATTPQVSC